MKREKPEVVELDTKKLEEVLHRAESALDEKDYQTIKAVIESYAYIAELVGDKNTTIRRLRKLLFGASTEKTETVLSDTGDGSTASASDDDDSESSEETAATEDSKPPPKGHGRNGADDYPGAEQIQVPHQSLEPGDPCPDCQKGTVYEMDKPGVLIRLVGQTPVGAKVYRLQKLRCNLCGKIFTAQAIRYLLKHWKKLTLFLRKAGAPLDNNICEQALKKAVLHRKAAMFYKTENGAHVGDLYMSLIHTCQLNGVNPFDYLTELQRHADELAASPRDWMPWNYRQTLAASAAAG